MPPKYGRSNKLRVTKAVASNRMYTKYGGYKGVRSAQTLQAAVKRVLNKKIETKTACQTSTDGAEIYHNNFVTLNSTMLSTTPGPFDPTLNASDCRIGDEINLKGVKVKMMVELNERYTNVTFRLLIIKAAKGDVPTRATLFNGLSGNKMIDTLNKERYTILAKKTFKIKAGNLGTTGSSGAGGAGSGLYGATDAQVTLGRATEIVSLWIDGTKFSKTGKIKYEQGSSQPKFFDYHCVLYAYSNWSTLQDVYYVARVNDYVQQIYYKDP